MTTWTVTAQVDGEVSFVSWTGIDVATPLAALREALVSAARTSVMAPELPLMLSKDDRDLLMRLLHEALTAPCVNLTFDQRRQGALLQERLDDLNQLATR